MATLEFSAQLGCSSTGSKSVQGLKCEMSTIQTAAAIHFYCTFKWNRLSTRVDAYEGYMMIKGARVGDAKLTSSQTFVDIDKSGKVVELALPIRSEVRVERVSFHFSLRPFSASELEPLMDANFAATKFTDANLIVEGKKLAVNKALLCHHSVFFRDLFTRIFRSDCEDVPIEYESAKNFVRFLSMIHQRPYFPNYHTTQQILESAERYGVPNVTRQVEHLLTRDTSLPNDYLLYLAGQYKLEEVEKKVLAEITTPDDVMEFRNSSFYSSLSDSTKGKLFEIVCELI